MRLLMDKRGKVEARVRPNGSAPSVATLITLKKPVRVSKGDEIF